MSNRIVLAVLALLLVVTAACGGGGRRTAQQSATPLRQPTGAATLPASRPTSIATRLGATVVPPTAQATRTSPPPIPTRTPALPPATATATLPPHRAITANDVVSEKVNYIDTLMVLVNFAGKPERVFDLRQHWDKIFGLKDPIRQLNAYYRETFYGQLELRPYTTPQMGTKGYVEVTLPGVAQDWSFGWLVNYESEDVDSLDADKAQNLVLEIMAKVVQKHPEINFQDKYVIVVMNAPGSEYGRGAAGVVPGDGPDTALDLFVGDVAVADAARFRSTDYSRVVESKLIAVVRTKEFTFADYFAARANTANKDQFIRGMAMFATDGPLSCASHDILHGLRRKSAYADPPEGRGRAVHCLYNLVQQSKWMVGTAEHGRFDRSIIVNPYIGWWDPMGEHLHPKARDFFASHPTGMSAFTKMRMGFIPERCLAIVQQDDVTINVSPLGNPTLPARGSAAEAIAIKVPVAPLIPALEPYYLLLEYRRRVGSEKGEVHADNFSINPDDVLGDKKFDPGYNAANPAASQYANPPTQFVPDEGVLVYLVNDKVPEVPSAPYTEWYNFNLALLNPAGNARRDDLNHVALDAGETFPIDLSSLIPGRTVPVKITVAVTARTKDYATVHITRQYTR